MAILSILGPITKAADFWLLACFSRRWKPVVTEAYAILSSCPSSTSTSGDDEVIGTGFNPPPETQENYTKQVEKKIQEMEISNKGSTVSK